MRTPDARETDVETAVTQTTPRSPHHDPCWDPLVEMLSVETTEEGDLACLERLLRQPSDAILLFLQRHRLDQLFLRRMLDRDPQKRDPQEREIVSRLLTLPSGDELARRVEQELVEPLRLLRRRQALSLMLRQEGARVAGEALEAAGIVHVLFKGILLGELLYGDPLLRPSADVDVLIDGADRQRTHEALLAAGFEAAPQADQPAYEISYIRQGANLDVHWHPIEPRRSRVPLTPFFLAGRQRRDDAWYPPPAATFLALLLNPAISDYVSERLIQPLDVDRFLRQVDFDPAPAVDLLRRAGLATAGWTMLEYSRRLFGTPLPKDLEEGLQPGPWRRRHLRRWLDLDPAHVYLEAPWRVRASFSLLLHDRWSDGLRALGGSLAEKWRTRRVHR